MNVRSWSDQELPVLSRSSSDVNQCSVGGFLGGGEKKKYMMWQWCLNGWKNYFQLQSGRNPVQSILGHFLPLSLSLSLSVSLQIFLVQIFSRACLQFVFLQKDVFANFKPDLQSLKAEVASDAHRFCWILFFPPRHACFQKWVGILPEMSTVTPTFGELFSSLLLYIFSLISGGREPTGIYYSISHPDSLQQLPASA